MSLFRTIGGALIGVVLAPATGGTSLALCALGGAVTANVAGAISDDNMKDEARRKGHEEGYNHGYKAGNNDAAKKFGALLEQSENMRIGAFAIGYYVARVDGSDIPDDELTVIVDALGRPDSKIHSDYAQLEMKKIMEIAPRFEYIRDTYLHRLNKEQLSAIDDFVREVIKADGKIADEERYFYNNQWKPFLKSEINVYVDPI